MDTTSRLTAGLTPRRAFLAAVLGALLVGCGSTLPLPEAPAPPMLAAAETKCKSPDENWPGEIPRFDTVIAVDGGGEGALLQVALFPDDQTYVYVSLCAFEGFRPEEVRSTIGIFQVDARFKPPITVDEVEGVDPGTNKGMAAGRVVDGVEKVEVEVEGGGRIEAVRSDCHWLAWWSGPSNAVSFHALDGSGNELGSVAVPPLGRGGSWTPDISPPHTVRDPGAGAPCP